jgi:signal transduction histidine kinase
MIQSSLMLEENRSKKIFIRMLAGLTGFTFCVSLIYFLLGLKEVALLNLLATITAPIAIWFAKRNFFLITKIFMHLLVLFVILGSACIYGEESMILCFLVPMVQSALTIFNREEWFWSGGFLIIILILTPWVVIGDIRFSDMVLSGAILKTVQMINVLGSIGFAVIQITYASWVNTQFREALELRNKESENTNQLLKSALMTRDQLFNMLAHDLRSPFLSLESGLIILDELGIPEDKNWLVTEIRNNARNTLNLLDNTLAWARSQTDNIKFEPEEFLLPDLLGKLQHNFNAHLKTKGLTLHFETNQDIRVFADFNMLTSILQNLVSNAIKFTPRNGNIWISAMGLVDGIEFRIRDSGTGMLPEEVNQILSGGTFSKPGTGREKGHGVGLLLVREFLGRHGSELCLKSAPGMGSEFSFQLPKRG